MYLRLIHLSMHVRPPCATFGVGSLLILMLFFYIYYFLCFLLLLIFLIYYFAIPNIDITFGFLFFAIIFHYLGYPWDLYPSRNRNEQWAEHSGASALLLNVPPSFFSLLLCALMECYNALLSVYSIFLYYIYLFLASTDGFTSSSTLHPTSVRYTFQRHITYFILNSFSFTPSPQICKRYVPVSLC